MATSYDNYPMGVNGSHDYFNQPDRPEWPECGELPDRGEWLCPTCEWRGECEKSEVGE